MEKEIKDKIVVITGGATGLGYQIAENFLKSETRLLIILDVKETEGNDAVTSLNNKHGDGKAVFIKCDVTKDLEEVSAKIFEKYKVDVLINNAGILDENSIRRIIEVNTIAVVEWSMKFLEHMRVDKGGQGGTILNIGSIYSFVVDPVSVFYKTSKYAVMGFTRTLGHEKNYEKFGVRVIILCPGFTRTALTAPIFSENADPELAELATSQIWQETDVVGRAATQIFRVAKSGSAWKIVGGQLDMVPVEHYQINP